MTMFGSFANYGFVRDTVPAELLANLQAEVDALDNNANRYNLNLAGNIESEYKLSTNKLQLEQYLIGLCNEYTANWSTTNSGRNLQSIDLELDTYWVNFQKKHEFNPMHTHDGIYSFAIWLKIPFLIADELNTPSSKMANMPRPGMFSFIYSNIFGETREAEFPVDKSYEGTIFLFPSCLPHTVYPFSTSDEYRISISGNLKRKQ
ncbi:Conserved hypothetical protein CHP02466 [uncultured Caudovirales phage]|uniref:Uncharacterized protein n=1 Tax=uncultured Caudovirales phage TaxID=2100421 RepID=A0A6J7WEJ4_9CAUD|nr:Conserved hypothetical protein CHP02466 [uncultured Caudovirales phage]CAB5209239.1 Conserved hypothetical protein CHP02466 [uncultured Caudovirales phage]